MTIICFGGIAVAMCGDEEGKRLKWRWRMKKPVAPGMVLSISRAAVFISSPLRGAIVTIPLITLIGYEPFILTKNCWSSGMGPVSSFWNHSRWLKRTQSGAWGRAMAHNLYAIGSQCSWTEPGWRFMAQGKEPTPKTLLSKQDFCSGQAMFCWFFLWQNLPICQVSLVLPRFTSLLELLYDVKLDEQLGIFMIDLMNLAQTDDQFQLAVFRQGRVIYESWWLALRAGEVGLSL